MRLPSRGVGDPINHTVSWHGLLSQGHCDQALFTCLSFRTPLTAFVTGTTWGIGVSGCSCICRVVHLSGKTEASV